MIELQVFYHQLLQEILTKLVLWSSTRKKKPNMFRRSYISCLFWEGNLVGVEVCSKNYNVLSHQSFRKGVSNIMWHGISRGPTKGAMEPSSKFETWRPNRARQRCQDDQGVSISVCNVIHRPMLVCWIMGRAMKYLCHRSEVEFYQTEGITSRITKLLPSHIDGLFRCQSDLR